MKLVEKKELNFVKNRFWNNVLSELSMRMFGINKINDIYSSLSQYEGPEFTGHFLKQSGITYSVADGQIQNIPEKGGGVIVCNHPTGALEGILLIDLVMKIRPDARFMGNYLLMRLAPLKPCFIEVDPFDPKSAKNIKGIRDSLEHVSNGGLLMIFPAGAVSTYQKGFTQLKDRPWSKSIMRFIRNAEQPVIPMYVDAANSKVFHVLGKLHPLLRMAMLPRELLNKVGKHYDIAIGAPLGAGQLKELKSVKEYSDYLRVNVYLLKNSIYYDDSTAEEEPAVMGVDQPAVEIAAELRAINNDCLLFREEGYAVYCAYPERIPAIAGAVREITAAAADEGETEGGECFRRLFVWDEKNSCITAMYRVGFGEEIISKHGQEGFYASAKFDMEDEMMPMLQKAVEVEPDFVRQGVDTDHLCRLLQKGLDKVFEEGNRVRYILGMVNVPGGYREASKQLMVDYIKWKHYDYETARNVTPVSVVLGLSGESDPLLVESIPTIKDLDKIVMDIEHMRRRVPGLLKEFVDRGGAAVGINSGAYAEDPMDILFIADLGGDRPE